MPTAWSCVRSCRRGARYQFPPEAVVTYVATGVIAIFALIIATALLANVRRTQRQRDGLKRDDDHDVCVSFWPCTMPFAAVQALRQEGLQQHTYEFFSTRGGEASVKLMAVVPV